MDEGLIIKSDGRIVGVVVPVRGGFMFFSSDVDLKILEGAIFPRVEMVTRRVAEIRQAKDWRAPAVDVGGRQGRLAATRQPSARRA